MNYLKYLSIFCLMLIYACSNEAQPANQTSEAKAVNKTSIKPQMNGEKVRIVNHYIEKLQAEEVRIQPSGFNWEADDLSVLIRNSEVVTINEQNKLNNVAHMDTLASLLWSAIVNKDSYKSLKIGLSQTDESNKEQLKWIDYATESLQ